MHTLGIKPTFVGHGEQGAQDFAANLGRIFRTGDTKMIATTGDLHMETTFNLSQMFVKLAAQVGQAFVVDGLENYVP